MSNACVVEGCESLRLRDKYLFFRFPSEFNAEGASDPIFTERRKRWILAVNRSDISEEDVNNERICSKHFVRGLLSSFVIVFKRYKVIDHYFVCEVRNTVTEDNNIIFIFLLFFFCEITIRIYFPLHA